VTGGGFNKLIFGTGTNLIIETSELIITCYTPKLSLTWYCFMKSLVISLRGYNLSN